MVTPIITAPASNSRCTAVAVYGGLKPPRILEPAVVKAALAAAEETGLRTAPTLVYLCKLEAGDSAFIPGGMRHNELSTSDDLEILEVSVPADMGTVPVEPPANRQHGS